MQYRPAVAADLPALARVAEPLQRRPDRHVVYVGEDADGIAAELGETTHDVASLVALVDDVGTDDAGTEVVGIDGGRVAGWLIGDVDDEMGRVWWIGPFVVADDWAPLATELLRRCRDRLPDGISEEEMAVDARFEAFAPWAEAMGFDGRQPGSWVLTLAADVDVGRPAIDVRLVRDDDVTVIELHERLFANTHTTGRQLIDSSDETHLRLVVEHDGEVVGYVAVERQPGGEGYVDYLGVAESHRRRGLGRQLVQAGVAALRELEAREVHLTVREDAEGARQLYESLGFVAERLIRPYRIGFEIL